MEPDGLQTNSLQPGCVVGPAVTPSPMLCNKLETESYLGLSHQNHEDVLVSLGDNATKENLVFESLRYTHTLFCMTQSSSRLLRNLAC